MKTAKTSHRNELSSIHAQINDIMGSTWTQKPESPRLSSRTRSLSGSYTKKQNGAPTPRSWNESFAFAIDG